MRLLIAALDDIAMRKAATDVVAVPAIGTAPWWLDAIQQHGYTGMMGAIAFFIAIGRAALIVQELREKFGRERRS